MQKIRVLGSGQLDLITQILVIGLGLGLWLGLGLGYSK